MLEQGLVVVARTAVDPTAKLRKNFAINIPCRIFTIAGRRFEPFDKTLRQRGSRAQSKRLRLRLGKTFLQCVVGLRQIPAEEFAHEGFWHYSS